MIRQRAGATAITPKQESNLLDEAVRGYYQALLSRLHWPPFATRKGENGSEGTVPALRCLGITSACRSEGVSTIAWQLSAAAAEMGAGRVLLVDANLEHPNVHRTFQMDISPGLAEGLLDAERLEPSIRFARGSSLSLLTSGQPSETAINAMNGTAIDETVEILRALYDLIVFDMPPSDEQSTTLRLAELMDGMLLVVEAERVCHEAGHRVTQRLDRVGARVLGAVLNNKHT